MAATGRNPLRLRSMRPAKFTGREVPDREWVVEGLIPSRTVTMIAGDGGLGKSLLAMMLQVACATGGEWLGRQAAQVPSIALYGEDDTNEIHRRLNDITQHNGIAFDDERLERMQFISVDGEENSLVDFATIFERETGERRNQWRTTDQWGHIYDWAVQEDARLVILDSLHDYFHGNENDRAQVRFFVNQLRVIAKEIDGAVVLLSHPSVAGMASGSGSSGSTAWNNAVRSRLYLTRPRTEEGEEPDADIRILKTMKANYGRIGEEIKLQWDKGVFVPVFEGSGGMVESIEKRNVEKAFLGGLRILQEQNRGTSDAKNAGNYAPKLVRSLPGFGQFSLYQYATAMLSLMGQGRVVKSQIGVGPNRHPIIGLVEIGGENGCA